MSGTNVEDKKCISNVRYDVLRSQIRMNELMKDLFRLKLSNARNIHY